MIAAWAFTPPNHTYDSRLLASCQSLHRSVASVPAPSPPYLRIHGQFAETIRRLHAACFPTGHLACAPKGRCGHTRLARPYPPAACFLGTVALSLERGIYFDVQQPLSDYPEYLPLYSPQGTTCLVKLRDIWPASLFPYSGDSAASADPAPPPGPPSPSTSPMLPNLSSPPAHVANAAARQPSRPPALRPSAGRHSPPSRRAATSRRLLRHSRDPEPAPPRPQVSHTG